MELGMCYLTTHTWTIMYLDVSAQSVCQRADVVDQLYDCVVEDVSNILCICITQQWRTKVFLYIWPLFHRCVNSGLDGVCMMFCTGNSSVAPLLVMIFRVDSSVRHVFLYIYGASILYKSMLYNIKQKSYRMYILQRSVNCIAQVLQYCFLFRVALLQNGDPCNDWRSLLPWPLWHHTIAGTAWLTHSVAQCKLCQC